MSIFIGIIIYIMGFIVAYYLVRQEFPNKDWYDIFFSIKWASLSWLMVFMYIFLTFLGFTAFEDKIYGKLTKILPTDPPKWLILILLVGSIEGCTNTISEGFSQIGAVSNITNTTCRYIVAEGDPVIYINAPCGLYKVGEYIYFTKDTTKH